MLTKGHFFVGRIHIIAKKRPFTFIYFHAYILILIIIILL